MTCEETLSWLKIAGKVPRNKLIIIYCTIIDCGPRKCLCASYDSTVLSWIKSLTLQMLFRIYMGPGIGHHSACSFPSPLIVLTDIVLTEKLFMISSKFIGLSMILCLFCAGGDVIQNGWWDIAKPRRIQDLEGVGGILDSKHHRIAVY